MTDLIRNIYKDLFPGEPLLVKSPGRINLIGEHVDYNGGFVLPAAIDRATYFAIAKSELENASIYSQEYQEFYKFNVDNPEKVESPAWANYLLGVINQLKLAGHKIGSFNCVFGGDIPIGAGMSSSASIECGFAFALNTLFNLNIDRETLIKMAQMAEHTYAGVKCGIMDQFASMMGKRESALLLDCRSLDHRYVPLALGEYKIVLFDTKVKHSLASSEYNKRRQECERGVEILTKYYPEVNSLRDVSNEMLRKHRDEFTQKEFDRCSFVVGEIDRVQKAVIDLEASNLKAFGEKMFETHDGLSKRYEVSCAELDFLVDKVRNMPGVIGARMMGGGFGGCTINIVKTSLIPLVVAEVKAGFNKMFNIEPEQYIMNVEQGTALVDFQRASII